MDDQLQVLLKEYDVMRTEIRLYINKYYLALTAILGIFSAGIFKSAANGSGFTYIWVPYLVAGILGFMALVTFFINKTAGYVQFIEWRINTLEEGATTGDQVPPVAGNDSLPHGLLLWETFYADYGMGRDSGRQFKSLFTWALVGFLLAGSAMLAIVIAFGYEEAKKWSFELPYWLTPPRFFLCSSISFLLIAAFAYWWVNTKVRDEVRKLNAKLRKAVAERTALAAPTAKKTS